MTGQPDKTTQVNLNGAMYSGIFGSMKPTVLVSILTLLFTIIGILIGTGWGAGARDEKLRTIDARVTVLEKSQMEQQIKLEEIQSMLSRIDQKLTDFISEQARSK